MIERIQRWYWNRALLQTAVRAAVLPGQISRGAPPELWNASRDDKRQWKLGLMTELVTAVDAGVKAAERLVEIGVEPNAVLIRKLADACHVLGHREGYWNSTGRRQRSEPIGGQLRAAALRGFDVALRIDASERGSLYGKGEIAFIEERFDDAAACFRRIIELEIDDVTRGSAELYLRVCHGPRQLANMRETIDGGGFGAIDWRLLNKVLFVKDPLTF